MKTLFALLLLAGSALGALPKPDKYFNDSAGIVSPAVAHQLNESLADYERATTNQILVAIYPKLDTDVTMEDLTLDSFRAWGVGQAAKNNGVVLFVFMKDEYGHGRDRIEVGRGLEGALTDSKSKDILSDILGPHLKKHEYDAGFTEAVNAMIKATTGEFKPGSVDTNNGGGFLACFIYFVAASLGAISVAAIGIFVLRASKKPVPPAPVPRHPDPIPYTRQYVTPVHRVSPPSPPVVPRRTEAPTIVPVYIPTPRKRDPDPDSSSSSWGSSSSSGGDSGWSGGGGDCGGGGSSDSF